MLMLNGAYSVFIVAADDAPRRRPWSVPNRRLTNYVLSCSLAGEEELRVGGESFHVPQGGSYMLPPCVPSDIECRNSSQPAWVHFEVVWNDLRGRHPWPICHDPDWESTRRFAQPSPREVWGVDMPVLPPEVLWPQIRAIVPSIITHWKSGLTSNILRAQHELAGLLLEWVCFEMARSSQPHMLSAHERIERAEALVRNDLAAGVSVSDMATAAGYSRSRFSEIYCQIRGKTAGQFLLQSRLQRAKALLRQTTLSAKTVAQLVGYQDSTAFGRAFRSEWGLSPLAWRKRQLKRAQKTL
jgi:AraC-like DNA-binding protein